VIIGRTRLPTRWC